MAAGPGPTGVLSAAAVLAVALTWVASLLVSPVADAAVEVRVTRCMRPDDRGSGTIVAPGQVLTAAHILDRAQRVDVVVAGRSIRVKEAVALPRADLAVLELDEPVEGPALVRRPVSDRDRGQMVGAATGGVIAFEVQRRVNVTIRGIAEGSEGVRRAGAEIVATVERGDSGAGLIAEDGALVGVLFARSTQDAGRAWATDIVEAAALLEPDARTAEVEPVPLGC